MPSKSFLTGFLGSAGQVLMAKKKQEYDTKLNDDNMKFNAAQTILASPDATDDARQYAGTILQELAGKGGGKGKGGASKGGDNSGIQKILAVTKAAHSQPGAGGVAFGGQQPGQPAAQPSATLAGPGAGPKLPSVTFGGGAVDQPAGQAGGQTPGQIPSRLFKTSEELAADKQKVFETQEGVKLRNEIERANADSQNRIRETLAKPGVLKEGSKPTKFEDIPESQRGQDMEPGKSYIPQIIGDKVVGWRAVEAPAKGLTGTMGQLKAAYMQQGMDEATAGRKAAGDFLGQRQEQQKERTAKFNQYMALSADTLLKDDAALAYMKENQPLLLESKKLGIDLSKQKIKTAEALADLLTKQPGSTVQGQSKDAVAQALKDEGFSADAKTPAAAPSKADAKKLSDADVATKKADFARQYDAAKTDAEKKVILAQMRAFAAQYPKK